MRHIILAFLLLLLASVAGAQPIRISGPVEYQWFGDSVATRSRIEVHWVSAGAPGGAAFQLKIESSLQPLVQTRVSANGVELTGRDRLGLTYACLNFLDSMNARGLEPYTLPVAPRTWDFTPKTTDRLVMINQRPDDEWPKARTQLLRAIYFGRASEVILAGFSTVWNPRTAPKMDALLSICDQYGLRARLITATFSKWWRGTVSTSRCLRSSIPTRERRSSPEPERLLDPGGYSSSALDAASGSTNRLYINVDFPREDDTYRLWALTYKLRPDPEEGNARARFMWYRNPRNADPNSDSKEVWRDFPLGGGWHTFRDTVHTLEELHWTVHFQCIGGKMFVDSVRLEEIHPGPKDVVACPNDEERRGWYHYQKTALSTYLSPMSLRADRDSSMLLMAQTMDSCYARFRHHPSFIGFFSSCDEVYVLGWEPEFMRRYANAGEGYVDLLRKVARKSHELFPQSRLLFYGDMLDPYHNARQYTRACNPRGGGFKDSRHFAEPDTSLLDIMFWGEEKTSTCRSLLEDFGKGWTWTAGITIGNRSKEDVAWGPLHPSKVCYFDWGDEFYTPAALKDLKERWYR